MLAQSDLNAGQRDAAKLVLTTTNRIVGVQGYAGVGKSHMLSKSVEGIKAETAKRASESGYRVIGLAPYGSQNKALKELGMDSQTLASFLAKKPEPGLLGPNTIVFLDEASVVPAHQMEALMKRIEQHGARLVLLGDRKQTQAVEAGKPFEQLQDAGMQLAHITEIQRQKNATLKAAV
ncbi:AAA family ATPase, partial [Burkholderia contaminans]|nr:AAA family ATPase [Burkholderia contaminans]